MRKRKSTKKHQGLEIFFEDSDVESARKKQQVVKGLNRCLLANDDPFLLAGYSGALSPHFDLIDNVVNGLEAVQAVKNNPPDHFKAIILDICMPIMDGEQACREILSHFDSLKRQNKSSLYSDILGAQSK